MDNANSTGQKNILLVDDDATIRDIIRSALQKEYNVIEASSYQEAINNPGISIDLALIDYMLPDRDGFDVLKDLRAVNATLPAIIITGHGSKEVVLKALRSTVADYIEKPLSLAYLRRRLSEIFGQQSSNEPSEQLETREEFILDGIAAHIKENYMKELTLDKLANMGCMNRFKLSRAFKKKFGITLTSYLTTVRVKNAAELFYRPDLNISEIAHSVGYSNIVHFDRVFRAAYGMTPSEYRKRINGKKEGIPV